MSDHDSELVCFSILEDIVTDIIASVEANSNLPERDSKKYQNLSSNLSDDGVFNAPNIPASSNKDFQDCTPPTDDDPINQEVIRDPSPDNSKPSSVFSFFMFEPTAELPDKIFESPTKEQKKYKPSYKEKVLKYKDNAESPKSEAIEDELIVKEMLVEFGSDDKSPAIKQKQAKVSESEDSRNKLIVEELIEYGKNAELTAEKLNKGDPIDIVSDWYSMDRYEPPEQEKADVSTNKTKLYKHGGDKAELPEENDSNTVLDREYFEYVLNGFYKTETLGVDECQGGDESSILPSFTCNVKKFRLIGYKENKNKFRLDVIVKQVRSIHHQQLYNSHIAVKNEEIVYNTIIPHLNSCINTTLPVPICFFANDQQIILQDLCGINYQTLDRKKGFITPKEYMYTLQALAKFHAATIVLKYKNNDVLKKIKHLTKDILYDTDSHLLKHQESRLKKILSDHKSRRHSNNNERKIKALKYLIKFAKNGIKDLLKKEQYNYVFCHGNLLLTNFLFKLNKKKSKKSVNIEEMDIKFIDFQNVHYCSVASDLVYLFFINLKPEDYIDNKEYLLHGYFFYLIKNIKDCGVQVDPKLTYEWLLEEIDRFTAYGIIYALWMLPKFDGIEDKHEEVTEEMLDSNLKYICYNERMRKWVDYYSVIYKYPSKEKVIFL